METDFHKFHYDPDTGEYYSTDANSNRTNYTDAHEWGNAFDCRRIADEQWHAYLSERYNLPNVDPYTRIPDAFRDAFSNSNRTPDESAD
jgi:hypothetical protein